MRKIEMSLGAYRAAVEEEIAMCVKNKVVTRIWDLDHTVWKMNPKEIANRLGWLMSPANMRQHVNLLKTFTGQMRSAGYTQALLLGMGGSSLAPDTMRKIYGVKDGFLDLAVVDSTDPAALKTHSEMIDPAKCLFIVSSKSGTTAEVLSFFKYYYNFISRTLGKPKAGEHFIAITDPGTPLNTLAEKYSFRRVFPGDVNIGGRFSALSMFGLLPGALIGMDIPVLLDRAVSMAEGCRQTVSTLNGGNEGARLGACLGTLAKAGRDKLTFFLSEKIEGFGDWVEQLIAESTGKDGKGILPVTGEPPDSPELYSNDRVFISMKLAGDTAFDPALGRLTDAGHPVIRIFLNDIHDIGGQFFLWEFATAIAGHVMEINPFDQPNVESAKVLSRKAMDEYRQKGTLSTQAPALVDKNISVYASFKPDNLRQALHVFLSDVKKGSYISIQAYLNPTRDADKTLKALRASLLDAYRIPTTFGYGPRFLHSTGQIHKGDAGKGFFIQITSEDANDLPIPDEAGSDGSSMTFGVLKAAQVLGDWEALVAAGRHIMRLHISDPDIPSAIERITEALR